MPHPAVRRLARPIALGAVLCATVADARAQAGAGASHDETPDSALVARIEDEGFNRSRVMDVVSWLTDVHGPRLTGSPATRAAAEWAMRTMTGWGLSNVRLESWGPFGRGWSSERFSMHALSPRPWTVLAYPNAWTPGTDGAVRGAAVLVHVDSEPDLATYRGRLRGAFVLAGAPRDVPARFGPAAARLTDAELDELARAPARPSGRPAPAADSARVESLRRAARLAAARWRLFVDEGVAAVLLQGGGDVGAVTVQSAGGSHDPAAAPALPTVTVAAEHYGRIARTLARGVPVTLELDARNAWHDADRSSFNVVAELPGTDPRLGREVVLLGAHFDSWHAGTGATDNAAGSAVMMEALRILRAARVPLRRTVRVALWTGEEQGLLGSRAYVRRHLVDPRTGAPTPEHDRHSLYLNLDLGTGKIRGVYLQGNEGARPLFGAWITPFEDRGMRTLTSASVTGTDHLSFDAVGIPAFQFIQDPVEYATRSHHSSADLYERVQADDVRWNAVVVAVLAMQAANRAERFPRKPPAEPAGGGPSPRRR